ncbi:MAG: PLD nuclease N-terminal domain-containing protein [Bacteroidales bacterium]
MGGTLLLVLFIILFIVLLPLFALVDLLTHQFPDNDKLIWVLIILFLPILGSVLYFLIGRDRRIR